MTVPQITNSRATVLAKVKVHSNITNWPEMLPTGWAPDSVSLSLSPIKKKKCLCSTLPTLLYPGPWLPPEASATNSSPEPVLRHSLPQVSVTDEWWCLAIGFQRFFSGSCWWRSVLLWWWPLLQAMALLRTTGWTWQWSWVTWYIHIFMWEDTPLELWMFVSCGTAALALTSASVLLCLSVSDTA